MDCVIVDIETTGLDPVRDRIIEISALKVKNFEIVDEFSTLVNPEMLIPLISIKLTGIDNSMVRHMPTIDKVIKHFTEFLGEDVFIAHNANFDYSFLANAAFRNNLKLNNRRLCTLKMARKLMPNLNSYKLSSLCNALEIINARPHRAREDAIAAYEIWKKLINNSDIKTIEVLLQ